MPADDDQLYQEHILEHYEDPYHRGHCQPCTHAHEDDNPLCGDVIRLELEIDPQGRLRQIYFNGDGCCISQAAASMLVEKFDGRTLDELKQFSANDMLALFGARLTPNRQKCCLLSWRVCKRRSTRPWPMAARCRWCAIRAPDCRERTPCRSGTYAFSLLHGTARSPFPTAKTSRTS